MIVLALSAVPATDPAALSRTIPVHVCLLKLHLVHILMVRMRGRGKNRGPDFGLRCYSEDDNVVASNTTECLRWRATISIARAT